MLSGSDFGTGPSDRDQDRTERRRREERNVVSLYFYWNNNTVLVFDNIPLQPLQNGFSSFSRIYSIYMLFETKDYSHR